MPILVTTNEDGTRTYTIESPDGEIAGKDAYCINSLAFEAHPEIVREGIDALGLVYMHTDTHIWPHTMWYVQRPIIT